MEFDTDILLVGGGLNGTALALALADGGFSVTIVDALPENTRKAGDFDGRGYALALASQKLLRALGVWQDVQDQSQPILDIKVTDGRAGEGPSPFVLHFDHAEIEDGPMGYMIEDRFLRVALIEALKSRDAIKTISQETVVAQEVDSSGATVTLASGKQLRAKLLIGSDGKTSGTAERAGLSRNRHDYGQTALVAAVAHEKPHNGCAHQFFMPSGPLAILPLPGNASSIVWSETHENAARISALDDDGFLEELRPRFGSFLGDISLAGKRFAYPLGLSLASALIAPRVALIGDAAHAIHPIAGQGLNLGLRDVGALAEVLVMAKRRGEDIGAPDVLSRYQQWRRFDTNTLAAATHGFNQLFSNDNSTLRTIRDIGLGAVNAVPGLRRRFIREAAGLTGDVPKLLQGQQI
ncbi:FAD-dependent monooxygenase [Halocynthiibacter sp. C4]|uniref:FAD-dependent monooxygenase n=1 Tax=Halocynthiibacter sp. C4 TaxID=2992758 RepID=UPI00237BFE0F|nr:FAD-dependent monooxygenase [Halocynthiibacter sp. C4]MDE0591085.1 FAD-dependent monooxygenase [Halocynthiibacter sp. C4]